ncbi:hypothetical protein ASPVEDRAFT_145967 [Aspergillus versicolor CBS 583.65]|uniref:Zn(2)-C6 fungal-type domain-containing protein n=1 Tax=Aspergillus versicolor CBS 583.65 TaxID=1036611 RepID=A0A1L9P4M7_ASPVE|nr:uncharacterized protein ASPVEDRAFT_145967 [Aspergillus versicolor CBS 583.65]OJI96475.1 hypothetical protein ASPVEDRAFT_145967 [Aspergillus versicolor CBS 583.65]
MSKRAGSQAPKNSRRAGREANPKRTNASCDACKSRKTKCINPVPGPCRYCAGISVPCTISIRRKQRPFYLVSEEEYRYGIEILQRLFPNVDLNIDTLRGLAQNMDTVQPAGAVITQCAELAAAHPQHEYTNVPSTVSRSDGAPVEADPPPSLTAAAETASSLSAPLDDSENSNDSLLAQLFVLQKACVVKDSLGATRYIGPGSDIPFISAVRSYAKGEGLPSPLGNFQHAINLPPPSPESRSSISDFPRPTYLPPLASWRQHIDRYFRVVNSTYWLISVESFCSRLDSTYATQSYQDISPSWLCFLYAILAITNQNPESSTIHDGEDYSNVPASALPTSGDPYTSNNYISMSKSLVKEVMDEATLDSIRALSAMSIFLHNQGFAVSSYLNVGTAVRIAYTLGLHEPQSYAEMTTIHKETALRVAWTLYELDACMSRPSGRPCNIDPWSWHPVMPSDMMVSTGTYDPWGLFNYSVAFNLKDQEIYAKLSRLPNSDDQRTVLKEINSSVTALQTWYDSLPPHLQTNATMAPPHKRPVYNLHLRYWNKIISITRLAVLADMQSTASSGADQHRSLSRISQLCVDASEHSQEILQLMHSSNDLSSLTVVDTKYILDVALVYLLLLTQRQSPEFQQRLDQCIRYLKSMDNLGFCRYAGNDLLKIIETVRIRLNSGGDRRDEVDVQMDSGEADVPHNLTGFGMEHFWTQEAWTAVTLGWNSIALSSISGEENPL